VIIATYAKSGTTWVQQIVGQLIFDGDPAVETANLSPWVDLRVPPKQVKLPEIEAQQHRRFLKTHLPVDALVFSPRAKYLYIGRDGRDVMWSMHNHHRNANAGFFAAINDTPGRVGPELPHCDPDIRAYFRTWLENDGAPFWPYWDNVRSWWSIRDLPNVMLVHFENLKRDLAGEMRRIAAFLEIDVSEAKWPAIVEHCSFDWMKAHAGQTVPLGGAFWDGGGATFINKGVNGRWRDTLTPKDIVDYERTALVELGHECARWLATGQVAELRA
jgi:aryl sulfotransferase